jgi:hypothetical protein
LTGLLGRVDPEEESGISERSGHCADCSVRCCLLWEDFCFLARTEDAGISSYGPNLARRDCRGRRRHPHSRLVGKEAAPDDRSFLLFVAAAPAVAGKAHYTLNGRVVAIADGDTLTETGMESETSSSLTQRELRHVLTKGPAIN